MIVTTAYFDGDLYIPNISGTLPVNVAVQSKINYLIAKHENEFLYQVLGEDFAIEFLAEIAGHLPADIPPPWKALYDLLYWTETIGSSTYYIAPEANYIYHLWLENQNSTQTTAGEGKMKVEGLEMVSPRARMVNNWNWMADKVLEVWDFLIENQSTYTTFVLSDIDVNIGKKMTDFQ